MKYDHVEPAVFLSRPNRFVARVERRGQVETVHVKNTGRCRELLVPGSEVYLSKAENPNRKTAYDLIAVRKQDGVLFNIDSQAPNAVVREYLEQQSYDLVRPEYSYGDSRIDFYLTRGEERFLLEIKGCTLEREGVGYFPDAPTERGVKHLRELIRAQREGFGCAVGFVIQMDGVSVVLPNDETHPEFGSVLREAMAAGVEVQYYLCHVEPDELKIVRRVTAKTLD